MTGYWGMGVDGHGKYLYVENIGYSITKFKKQPVAQFSHGINYPVYHKNRNSDSKVNPIKKYNSQNILYVQMDN